MNSYLTHEIRDDPVENGSPVAKPFLSSAQSSEVFCSFRDDVGKKLYCDLADWLVVSSYSEKYHWVAWMGKFHDFRRLGQVHLRHAPLTICKGFPEGFGNFGGLEFDSKLLHLGVTVW